MTFVFHFTALLFEKYFYFKKPINLVQDSHKIILAHLDNSPKYAIPKAYEQTSI